MIRLNVFRISNVQKQLLFHNRKSYDFIPSFFHKTSAKKKFDETFAYIFGGVLVRFQVRISSGRLEDGFLCRTIVSTIVFFM